MTEIQISIIHVKRIEQLNDRNPNQYLFPALRISKNKKKGYYVCFNGGLKPNRVLLINELVRLGIHKNAIFDRAWG